jgi:Spy/CpxP family protein refolding chaperone
MRHVATICTVAALSAAAMFAQGTGRRGPGGTPPDPQAMVGMRVNRLATVLSLTDAQKAEATSIFTNAHTASQGVQTNLRTVRESLAEAVKKNDAGSIDALATQTGTLTGQLIAIESKADAAFYALLTPDQQAKYDAMPRGVGFGGPGGGGPMGGFGPPRGSRSPGQ